MRRAAAALAAGLVIAFAISAQASEKTIVAQGTSWSPSTETIQVGDTITWTNPGKGFHNVCVQKPGTSGSDCDEYTNGQPSQAWTSTVAHTFTTPGTYKFYCEAHRDLGMTGTITVNRVDTGTSTTPPPDTMPTDTTTVPTGSDTTDPRFDGRVGHKVTKKTVVLSVSSTEPGKLIVTVLRRKPGTKRYVQVSQRTVAVEGGDNSIKLARRTGAAGKGSFRVTLQLVDAAGNKSAKNTVNFKIA